MGPGFFEEVADLIASNRFLEDEIEQDGKIRSGRLKAFLRRSELISIAPKFIGQAGW
jgi:hypothetical protein